MTREEAIDLLQSRLDLIKKDYPDIADYAEALEMAIEALNQFAEDSKKEKRTIKRTETHSCDLIDREAAVDAIYHHLPSVSRTRARTMLHEVPSAQPDVPDTNVGDTISRQAAIEALHMHLMYRMGTDSNKKRLDEWINNLPPAQPEIIRCRNCKFASGDSRICMKFDHSPIGELDFCSFAERREVNHESN